MTAILSAFGGGGQQPYQFRPESYGAFGNGIACNDVTTNGTLTVTSPTMGAKASAGQYVMIHGANGGTNGPYLGQIASISGNNITLTAGNGTPSGSVSNCPAVFGTDDTPAINSAITAAATFALAGSYTAEILFSNKIYILGTGPTQIGNGTSLPTFNSQIPMPFPAANGTSQKLIILLTGAGDSGYYQFWNTLTPSLSGSCLVSMLTTSSTPNATFGRQSVIGGPTGAAGFTTPVGGVTTAFANTKVLMRGISVWLPIYTNIYAVDFRYLSAARAEKCACHIFAPTGVNTSAPGPYMNNLSATAFTSSVGSGFAWPVTGNNADSTMDECTVQGYEQGYLVFDHFTAEHLNATYCDVVVKNDGTLGLSGTQHGLFFNINAEQYNGGLRTNGGTLQVEINWDSENSATPIYDVNDAGNALWGVFKFGNKVNNIAPILSGAANLQVVNANLAPGVWAGAPAAPASGTAQQNTSWRDATVYVSSTVAITAITVDSTVTGLTAGAGVVVGVRVPAGHSYTITAAGGTQTTHWILE